MAVARNCNNDRVPNDALSGNRDGGSGFSGRNSNETAKQNFTAIRYGNDHGSVSFGHIHKQGDVTAGVMLQTSDSNHSIFMDKDGQRKGWTTLTAPANVQIEAGSANEEAQDTLMINAKNGNILITASNGKIRLEGTDIELIATGEGGSKGNIRMDASENVSIESKKFLVNSKSAYKIVTSGTGEIVANSILKMYGSIFKAVDDSCAVKDAKNGGKRDVDRNNQA